MKSCISNAVSKAVAYVLMEIFLSCSCVAALVFTV